MQLAGKEFSVDKLEPFGEVWTPRQPLLVDSFLEGTRQGDIGEIVQAVREASVVVIKDSSVGRYWLPVPPDPISSIAHTDVGPYSDPVALHMLHSKEGRAVDTSYARNADLVAATKSCIQDLRDLVATTPKDICEEYRLGELLERYEHPEAYYSFDFLDPHTRMGNDLGQMNQQMDGFSLWIAGQNLDEIRAKYPKLLAAYRGLMEFYRKVSATSQQLVHSWSSNPNTTVLAYQDPTDRFTESERVISHFRTSPNIEPDEKPIHRDLVLGDSFSQGPARYIPYSAVLQRDSRA